MVNIDYGNRNFEMQQAESLIRDKLKEEYAARDAIVKQAKELEEIVTMAIAACQDHAPFLAAILLEKAEAVFKGPKPPPSSHSKAP